MILLNYQDAQRNQLAQTLFKNQCAMHGISIDREVRYSADMRLYRVTLDNLEELETVLSFEGVRSIEEAIPIRAGLDTIDDFSFDETGKDDTCRELIDDTIALLNKARAFYLDTKDKKFWRYMIELLPSSYNQRRTYQMNYEVLASIYRQRKNHKLTEWHTFCGWIKSLPYSELITEETENDCR